MATNNNLCVKIGINCIFSTLDIWLPLDPAGSIPDPGISGHLTLHKKRSCKSFYRFNGMRIQILAAFELDFCTPGSCRILLGAILIQVQFSHFNKNINMSVNFQVFRVVNFNSYIIMRLLYTWQLLNPVRNHLDPGTGKSLRQKFLHVNLQVFRGRNIKYSFMSLYVFLYIHIVVRMYKM